MSEYAARVVKAHLYGTVVISVFIVFPGLYLRRFDALLPFSLPAALSYPGLAVLIAGSLLSYTSFWYFVQEGKATAFPTDPPKELVIAGPYLYSRNPMYLGNLGIIFGAAFYLTSAMDLLYAAVLSVLTHFYITKSEEPVLVARYGEPYLRYVNAIPRWMPRVSRDRADGAVPHAVDTGR